jgi:hypothetical protein
LIGMPRAQKFHGRLEVLTAMQTRVTTTRYQLPLDACASMSALVLKPVAVLAGTLGAWRLAADFGWTNGFFIADGLLARYQVWFAIAISLQTSALVLNRWVADRDTPNSVNSGAKSDPANRSSRLRIP